MNLRLSILTLFRSPTKTLLTFMLLVTTSFSFVSRVAEYFITEQVITEAEREYVAVGTLVATADKYRDFYNFDPSYMTISGETLEEVMERLQYFCPIDEEALDLILSTDYIETSEVRHVAGGITPDDTWTVMESPTGINDDIHGHTLYNAIVIVYCYTTVGDPVEEHEKLSGQVQAFYTIEEVLAGDPELWPVGEMPEFYVSDDGVQHKMTNHVTCIAVYPDDPITGKLIAGHRYVLALTPWLDSSSKFITGRPILDSGERIPNRLLDLTLLEEEKGSPVTYEDYAYFLEDRYGAIMVENHHKQELVYTSDMSLLPRFHDGTLYMTEGRMITPEDDGYVCVINAEYAARNGIEVGDTIDFDVDPDTMVYGGEVFAREIYAPLRDSLGAQYTAHEQAREPRSYEVVGIWTGPPQDVDDISGYSGLIDYDPDALKYALNTVFVPEETYPWPDEIEPHSFPVTFSFELKHPRYASNLEVELGDKLEELGYKLVINDLGYSDVEAGFTTMRIGALIGLISMGVALLFSLVLIVYLFIIRRKSEFAIMRALGVPSTRASRSLLAGLFVLAGAAVAVGSGAAVIAIRGYAMSLARSMAELTDEAASVSYSPWLIPVFGAGVLAVLLIFAAIGLRTVGKKPPLELLQDSN